MRPRLILLIAVLATVLIGLGNPAARAADDGQTGAGTPLPASAADVATELDSLQSQLFANRQQNTAVQTRLTEAAIALDATEQQLTTVAGQIEQIRAQLREKAAVAYVRHQTTGLEAYSVGSRLDYASGSTYLHAASDLDEGSLSDLLRSQEQLEAARDERKATRDDLADRADALARERIDLEDHVQRDEAVLQKWGAITIMGDAELNPAQMAAWYASTGAQAALASGITMDDVTRMYIEEGQAEHVRGDLAYAQAIVETGGFKVAAGNNYSGIGVCDSCKGGNAFASPRSGIRAQIQLLRNYADPSSRASNLRYPPEPGLYGSDPDKAAHLYDTFFLKGKAPLWNLMGHGNWATDPNYAPKVIDVYVQMVLFANAHPA